MTKAKMPSRGSGKLTINFGIVPIPVAVFNGVEEQSIKRHMRSPGGNSVNFVTKDSQTGDMISRQECSSVFVMDDGSEVPLSDDEIAKAMGEENGSCSVVGFYPLSELSKYTVASVLQVRPQKDGKKKSPFDRPFSLLMSALATRKAFALVRYTLRGKPRLGALTAEGVMQVLYWDDEVREARPMPNEELSAEELALGGQLVDSLMGETAPALDNEALMKVREYVAAKAAGTVKVEEAPKTESMDLMAALTASLKKASA